MRLQRNNSYITQSLITTGTTIYMEAVQMLGGTDNESVDLFWTKKD